MNDANLSILVVDDDQIVRFVHKKVIESLVEFKIIYNEAANGERAIQVLNGLQLDEKGLPNLILLDINMPVLDGFGFIQVFQKSNLKNKEKTQIIIVSSSEDAKDRQHSFDLGITQFITKPVTREKLESIILHYELLRNNNFIEN